MFGFIGMVFLVAISLTSESHGLNVPGLSKVMEISERAEVVRMMEALFENYDYLDDCYDTLRWSMNVTACEQLAVDLVALKDFLFTAVEDALTMAEEAETIKNEYDTCSTESIFKQITCYKNVIVLAENLDSEAKTDVEEFTEDGKFIEQQINVNFANCFKKGLSVDIFEKKMRQCKLKLKVK